MPKSLFAAGLVNGPFGDPGVLVDFRFASRALLIDLGDIAALSPKKILRITDVFVSHTHMDHFCGFDRLLRVCLGRGSSVRLFGPPGFVGQVGHKLAAYTWNLVENYAEDFVLDAHELGQDGSLTGRRFRARARFQPEPLASRTGAGGILVEEPMFRVKAALLDHGIPCLAFAVEEKSHVNIWKNRLSELGLPTGTWLKTLKEAVLDGLPDDAPIRAYWRDRHGEHERVFPLGALKGEVVRVVPGETLAYVTDIAFHEQNRRRVAELAAGATRLFIECPFLHEDAQQAAARSHLTARQAGELARACGAGIAVPFHFSPRYEQREDELRAEIAAAHEGR